MQGTNLKKKKLFIVSQIQSIKPGSLSTLKKKHQHKAPAHGYPWLTMDLSLAICCLVLPTCPPYSFPFPPRS